MITRKALYKDPEKTERWALRPEMHVSYEFDFKGQTVKPGMQFRVKNDRTNFTFLCLVHNASNGKTWLECTTPEGFRSIRPEKVFKLVGIKRSYKKKQK